VYRFVGYDGRLCGSSQGPRLSNDSHQRCCCGRRHSQSHGISKSAATIALAGLIWVGIVSGIPDIQPASAAEATDNAPMDLLADQIESLGNKMNGLATKEDVNEIYVALTALVLTQGAAVLATYVFFNDSSDAKELFYTDTIGDKLKAAETRTELKILNYLNLVGAALLSIFFIQHSDTASMAQIVKGTGGAKP
jgi:hypothetical protein